MEFDRKCFLTRALPACLDDICVLEGNQTSLCDNMYSLLGEEEELLVACCSVTNCDCDECFVEITFVERHFFEREREREMGNYKERERDIYVCKHIYVCAANPIFLIFIYLN